MLTLNQIEDQVTETPLKTGQISFLLNGKQITINDPSPTMTYEISRKIPFFSLFLKFERIYPFHSYLLKNF